MRPSRKPRIILFILIALCGIFVFSYTARLGEKSRVQAAILDMQVRIDEAHAEQYRLKDERDELNQPDFLDHIARKNFGLAKPGDKLLVIIDEATGQSNNAGYAVSTAATVNPIDYRNFPVWQQWIVFFTTSSFKISLQ